MISQFGLLLIDVEGLCRIVHQLLLFLLLFFAHGNKKFRVTGQVQTVVKQKLCLSIIVYRVPPSCFFFPQNRIVNLGGLLWFSSIIEGLLL